MKRVFYFACFMLPAAVQAQSTTTTVTQQTTVPGNATINMNIGGMPMGTTTQQTTTTTITTTTSGDMNQPQSPPPPTAQPLSSSPATGCQAPMNWDDYQGAKSSIEEKTFEDTKLTLAKQISASNCLSAEQIRGIMKTFTFENSKLDFAKYAYATCCDKANYFKVNDAFQFDNSSQELNNYISSQPH
jgi:hypothetical protein